MLAKKLMGAAAAKKKLFVDSVFSAYLYTGNGGTQTINNGIDLAGKGGLVWTKRRDAPLNHLLRDTSRGTQFGLTTNNTGAQINGGSAYQIALSDKGYSWTTTDSDTNANGGTYASWTFRKAPKFLDIVTYTGNGVAGRQIPHELGIKPGFVAIKCTSDTGNWICWARMTDTSYAFSQNQLSSGTFGFDNARGMSNSPTFPSAVNAADATTFSPYWLIAGTNIQVNEAGKTYVAYLFAHDDSEDGIIQCGSYETSTTPSTIVLGSEPQFLMVKKVTGTAENWSMIDTMRGMTADGNNVILAPNTSGADDTIGNYIRVTADGFKPQPSGAGNTYIYLAIRRPNKPPTSGTEVYNAIARTGTGANANITGAGLAPDAVMTARLAGGGAIYDKLRGTNKPLILAASAAEATPTFVTVSSFDIDGYSVGPDNNGYYVNPAGQDLITHLFRRAPGFFDIVCYTGNGVARTVPHGLGVAPELIIVKNRTGTAGWQVYCQHLANPQTSMLVLNGTQAKLGPDSNQWNNTLPTLDMFSIGTYAALNSNGAAYVAYLFSTLPGISKVGSYTGNGTTQTIPCGFTTGARFILIKRTDAAGDWYVWDSARGIVAANDPHLSLNTTAAEVTTDDSVDPHTSGFIVNQVAATSINVSGGTYIFLAVA